MYKTKLQELCHQYGWNLPEYGTEKEGPDHNPRFTATVTVNGFSFASPKDHCRSSKEAQNLAAHIAFAHFTSPKSAQAFSHHNLPSPSPAAALPASSSSGASTSSSKVDVFEKVDVGPPNMDIFQQRQNNAGQPSRVNGTPLAGRDANTSKGMLHLYKNRLQQYAQKQNLTLPVYSSELDGPPHACRFRSKVTIDGKTYETQEFFSTLKEAEHAAAKGAFESLALNDIQEDEGLYKTLLQELAQKEGLLFPVYDTARAGPPHAPTFSSTVEVGGGTFQGQEAKTKKQAEMNAAKVAYNALVKRKGSQIDLPDGNLKSILGVASSSSQSTIEDSAKHTIRANEVENDACNRRHTGVSVNKETDTNANRHRCSTASKTYSVIRDPCPAASCLPDGQSSASVVFDHSTDSVAESVDSGTYAGTSILPNEKIFIFPRNENMELPNGACVLPCSDEKWVAASLELNRNR
ncbi:double-stranded RNA-binding protein 4-like isoform X2 [Nicotiana tomentosiformis]|uniref:double-stranded RNA-binding protein 4-like isoform X2 n=1 Tax=Nicotiana tomentosiformis TaxID=4098 RepID=UPI000877EDAB|nr:double-stranded RNA-binding protein 4-like isoform X2 [Nicotiana tomentosiformis]